MKNSAATVLICITLAFAAFVAGIYLGKNDTETIIEISGLSATTPARPTSPTMPNDGTVPAPTVGAQTQFPININTATLEQLDLIPGIGPVLAQRILDYREEIGQFHHVEELLDVSGIGEKTLANMLQYITI